MSTESLLHIKRDAAFLKRGKPIVYTTQPVTSPNFKTGEVHNGQTPSSIDIRKVLVGYATDDDVKDSDGRYKRTDRVFRIKASDMPMSPPPKGIVITYNSRSYRVIGHRSDPSDYVYDHFAREL